MKVLAGTSNLKLCKDIARQLKLKLVNSNIKRFINQNKKNESFFEKINNEKYNFNLRDFINKKIFDLNVKNIENIDMNTYSEKDFFYSYRRSCLNKEQDYGRCISVILMT